MIPNAHWLVLVYFSAILVPLVVSGAPPPESVELLTESEGEATNKRAWKDVSGSWGKRGWNDLEGTWGKRAWERMNGAWGKRRTLNPEESVEDDLLSEVMKRPEWSKFKGSWGKRVPDGEKAGWSNLKGLWGKKRAWEKLGNSWGKRTEPENTMKMSSGKQPLDNLHLLAEGGRSE